MRVTVLGSGQDGGLPQAGARHPNDEAARAGELPERTGPSLLVEDGPARLLCDVSPDFRVQWWAREGLPDSVALTHAHMGHYGGLVHLGTEAAAAAGIALWASSRMVGFLRANQPWGDLLASGRLQPATGSWEEHVIELIDVPHRAEHTDTVAVSIDRRVLWLPDIDSWDAWPASRDVVDRHELAFLDGSFWSADEIGGRSIDDIPHPLVPDTLQHFSGSPARIVLVHLNHTNPICDPTSPESAAVRDAGFEIASDGWTTVV